MLLAPVPVKGLEQGGYSQGETAILKQPEAEPEADADLKRVIGRWSQLDDATRITILRLID